MRTGRQLSFINFTIFADENVFNYEKTYDWRLDESIEALVISCICNANNSYIELSVLERGTGQLAYWSMGPDYNGPVSCGREYME